MKRRLLTEKGGREKVSWLVTENEAIWHKRGVRREVYIRTQAVSLLWRGQQVDGWPKGGINRLGRFAS